AFLWRRLRFRTTYYAISLSTGVTGVLCCPRKAVGMGSTMGYSGQTAPMSVLTCLPEDWWDPAWQAAQSPGVTVPERGIWEPRAAGSAESEAAADEPTPTWRQVLGTTFSLWTSRHLRGCAGPRGGWWRCRRWVPGWLPWPSGPPGWPCPP